jgi:polyphosphate kinase 2 (PPK2 family)
MVLMNRSWYNRTGVERVMGYCSDLEHEDFMRSVLAFEHMLVGAGIQLFKYYLDISKEGQKRRFKDRRINPLKQWKVSPIDKVAIEHEEFMRSVLAFEHMLVGAGIQLFKYYLDISKEGQKRRFKDRRINPLKQWKVSPIDKVAIEHWDDYSAARNEMFERTHNETTPWYVVRADNKKRARLNVIRHLMSLVDCPDKDEHAASLDPEIVFTCNDRHLESGAIAE